jgi:hypothetical protein
LSSKSLPEVSEKWDNSECKDCPIGDKSLYRVSGKPCLEKKRIVMKGSFCAIKPKTVQNERENKP